MIADGSTVTGRLLEFRVGPGRFAVFLEDVLGIRAAAEIGAVNGSEVIFDGQPAAAVDARELWRGVLDAPATGPAPVVIVVGSGGGSTALMVDRVEGIVEGVEMRPLPALVAPFVKEAFRGVTVDAQGGRLVVDPGALPGAAGKGGDGGPGKA